ncbi:MAG: SocA family protein [Elusimicrobiota bacterium]|jgi:hypothetical protein|nr:SocA family protein [Elusimicrobiota bacterium]
MDFKKLVQMVNYVLAKYDFSLNYTKLIKLLYLSDRLCLERWDFAISGDEYFSMPKGPVLSGLFDFIRNKGNADKQVEWNNSFDIIKWDIVSNIKKDCSYDKLSKAEKMILDEIDNKYHDKDIWYLVNDVAHKLPEWDKEAQKHGTSIPLEYRTILKALGKSEEEIENILKLKETCEIGRRLLNA